MSEEIDYYADNIRRTRLGCRFIFFVSVIVSIVLGFKEWWPIPVLVSAYLMISEIICIKAVILFLLESKERKKSK